MVRRLLLLAASACLVGCAAREVTPVRMTQTGDEALSCPELQKQLTDNQAAAQALLVKDKEVSRANTAKVIGSAIPYAGILIGASTDLSNDEQIRARALLDRNDWLTLLAKRKGCTS